MNNFNLCGDPDHWVNILFFGKCFKCVNELPPLGLPSDEEIEAMAHLASKACYECVHQEGCSEHKVESASEAYRTAH